MKMKMMHTVPRAVAVLVIVFVSSALQFVDASVRSERRLRYANHYYARGLNKGDCICVSDVIMEIHSINARVGIKNDDHHHRTEETTLVISGKDLFSKRELQYEYSPTTVVPRIIPARFTGPVFGLTEHDRQIHLAVHDMWTPQYQRAELILPPKFEDEFRNKFVDKGMETYVTFIVAYNPMQDKMQSKIVNFEYIRQDAMIRQNFFEDLSRRQSSVKPSKRIRKFEYHELTEDRPQRPPPLHESAQS